jgi:hypothetical protein
MAVLKIKHSSGRLTKPTFRAAPAPQSSNRAESFRKVLVITLGPFQTHSSTPFFAGGKSFTAQDAVIESALATGTSAYYGDRWYVAVPLYSLVLLEGFTLTGQQFAMVFRRYRRRSTRMDDGQGLALVT